jgi:uncharacterized C2H2 Zn-finger protein
MLQTSLKKKVSYHCEKCNYTTGDKKDFNKHNLTPKHNKTEQLQQLKKFMCKKCDKVYKFSSGLSRHTNEEHSLIEVEEQSLVGDVSINEIYRMQICIMSIQNKTIKLLEKLSEKIDKMN